MRVVGPVPDMCFSRQTLLYCSKEPNIRAVVALFCIRGGRIPRYKLRIPSARSWEAASQAEIPCSCCRNIVLLTGKVREMLMMPLPHPAAYSRQSPGYFLSVKLSLELELEDIKLFSLTIIVLSRSTRLFRNAAIFKPCLKTLKYLLLISTSFSAGVLF